VTQFPDDNEYIYAFERLIFPILKKFDPELMIVSAGFDSAKGDPLGDLGVTQDGSPNLPRIQLHDD
jgi:histone deacetylase 6